MIGGKDQDMVQAFFSDSPNPSFSKCIGIRSLERGVDDVKAFRMKDSVKSLAEFSIVVVDQEMYRSFVFLEFPNQLPGLLSDPDSIGISCNACKVNPARTQFDEEEHIDGLKP